MTPALPPAHAERVAAIMKDPIFMGAFQMVVNSCLPGGDPSNGSMSLDQLALEAAYARGFHDFGRRLAQLAAKPVEAEGEETEPWSHIGKEHLTD